MKYDPSIHQRRSIRLKGYDYTQAGMYFITICTQNHECFFGEIKDEKMQLNDTGKMVEKWYFELTNKFPDIQCDEYIIMPNHIHFIINKIDQYELTNRFKIDNPKTSTFVGADLGVCPTNGVCPNENKIDKNLIDGNKTGGQEMGEHKGSPLRYAPNIGSLLPKIVQWFKTMTTNEFIRWAKKDKLKTFKGKLWQRNYYEHIIRNENELNQIREYIINNPLKWNLDEEYFPGNI